MKRLPGRSSSQRSIGAVFFIVFSVAFRQLSQAETNPSVAIPPRALPTNGPPIYFKDWSTQPTAPDAIASSPPESPAMTTNFPSAQLFPISPPDTHGAVGTNDVVTILNRDTDFQTRGGLTNLVVENEAFWNGTSGEPFDPRIVYDPYHHRWIATAVADMRSSNSGVLVGVSQTSNPTNSWYIQRFKADTNSLLWADSPTVGFNKDWIVVHVDLYTTNDHFVRSEFYVFNKTNAYAGDLTNYTFFTHNSSTNAGRRNPGRHSGQHGDQPLLPATGRRPRRQAAALYRQRPNQYTDAERHECAYLHQQTWHRLG